MGLGGFPGGGRGSIGAAGVRMQAMTKARKDLDQDALGRASGTEVSAWLGWGSGSPLQRWSNVCFLPSAARRSVTKSHGLQFQDGGGLGADQSAIGGI